MGSQSRPVKDRARAGELLAMLGDPRFRADAWYLPNDDLLGFLKIPAGPFLMGEGQASRQRESPQHTVNLPSFYLNRHPVTIAQFRCFLIGTGHPDNLGLSDPMTQNHPVTAVSWHEAMGYCHWLTDRLRRWEHTPTPIAHLLKEESWVVMLPSEAEWEKAARGMADARRYPWGFAEDANRANSAASGLRSPTAVGCFAGGVSPFGMHDMSGNVCEWTRSNWGTYMESPQFIYPYQQDAREDLRASDRMLRVCRGGSCYSSPEHIRCTHRSADFPTAHPQHIGFRLAITLLPS
jgi:formylglycine-generating enzyme required for sulfatase activity